MINLGVSTNGQMIGELCGGASSSPVKIISTLNSPNAKSKVTQYRKKYYGAYASGHNTLSMVLTTNSVHHHKGFKAHYVAGKC